MIKYYQKNITKRKKSVRSKIVLSNRPRLSVFRSAKYTYAQLINDQKHRSLLTCSSREIKKTEATPTKVKHAYLVGQKMAELALKMGIKKVVFDRSGHKYHGRIKAVADGARKNGLIF